MTLPPLSSVPSRVVLAETAGAGRLGRHIEHDARSRLWAIEDRLFGAVDTVWWNRRTPILDQGDLGSCTGNAMAGALGCEPLIGTRDPEQLTELLAVRLYERATQLDHFPGEYPPEDTGSSGLAVAKAARELGFIGAYHHAFTTIGMLRALQHGPVIVGISWYEGFDAPDIDGIIEISGQIRGGHEVLIRGYDHDAGLLHGDNSWGPQWGARGSFSMSLDTWARLRRDGADVTVPVL